MTIAVIAGTSLLIGWLAGRRQLRRALQTTDGRARYGRDAGLGILEPVTTPIAEAAPPTRPLRAVGLRTRTAQLRVVQ